MSIRSDDFAALAVLALSHKTALIRSVQPISAPRIANPIGRGDGALLLGTSNFWAAPVDAAESAEAEDSNDLFQRAECQLSLTVMKQDSLRITYLYTTNELMAT